MSVTGGTLGLLVLPGSGAGAGSAEPAAGVAPGAAEELELGTDSPRGPAGLPGAGADGATTAGADG